MMYLLRKMGSKMSTPLREDRSYINHNHQSVIVVDESVDVEDHTLLATTGFSTGSSYPGFKDGQKVYLYKDSGAFDDCTVENRVNLSYDDENYYWLKYGGGRTPSGGNVYGIRVAVSIIPTDTGESQITLNTVDDITTASSDGPKIYQIDGQAAFDGDCIPGFKNLRLGKKNE